MSRRRRRQFPAEPVEVSILGLSHDGRGIAEQEGKKVFVHGALPDERVLMKYTGSMRRYDEGEAVEVLQASPHRVEPRCPHFGLCGGCALQHMEATAQIQSKQDSLVQNLQRIGKVSPQEWLPPLVGPQWNYRRKARLSARYVFKKEKLLLGFRERKGRYVAEMSECHVLDERIANVLPQLTALLSSLAAREQIPQIEVACGDRQCALIVRHLVDLDEADLQAWREFSRQHGIAILLQAGGPDSVTALEPPDPKLEFDLPEFDLTLQFGPADFIQVNAELNRKMVSHALDLLQPEPADRVLDLFCGLGNFTLPLARLAGEVVGVEGDAALVEKARANARRNGLDNVSFHMANLMEDQSQARWLKSPYDKVLIDPPRSGAEEMLPYIAATGARRLVYVSCHPASLARDAGILVEQHGFVLQKAGVMDMFPHTGHVESIALFERQA